MAHSKGLKCDGYKRLKGRKKSRQGRPFKIKDYVVDVSVLKGFVAPDIHGIPFASIFAKNIFEPNGCSRNLKLGRLTYRTVLL